MGLVPVVTSPGPVVGGRVGVNQLSEVGRAFWGGVWLVVGVSAMVLVCGGAEVWSRQLGLTRWSWITFSSLSRSLVRECTS